MLYPAHFLGSLLLKNPSMFDGLRDQPLLDAHVRLGFDAQACAELLLRRAQQMKVCGIFEAEHRSARAIGHSISPDSIRSWCWGHW